jgi:adenylate cyclase
LTAEERGALQKAPTTDVQAYDYYLRGRKLRYHFNRRDIEFAIQLFSRAVELDSAYVLAHAGLAGCYSFARGESDQALRLYEQAMRVRPEDYQSPLLVGQIYDDLGRPRDARASRERGVRIAEEHLKLNPDDARAVYMAANGLVALGERERGREWAQRALAMEPGEPMALYNVGCIYSLLGLVEQAIDCLERAARNGLMQQGWSQHDSNLDPLRTHPRFQSLLRLLE